MDWAIPIDASYQVSVYLAKLCQRRRLLEIDQSEKRIVHICRYNSASAHFHVLWLSDFIFYQKPLYKSLHQSFFYSFITILPSESGVTVHYSTILPSILWFRHFTSILTDNHETLKYADIELQRQICCFPYGERSDVPRLQQVEQKVVRRQSNLGLPVTKNTSQVQQQILEVRKRGIYFLNETSACVRWAKIRLILKYVLSVEELSTDVWCPYSEFDK
jgi:hypothetical protein